MSYQPKESNRFKGWYESPDYPDFLANRKGMIWNIRTNRKTYGSLNDSGYLRCCMYDNRTDTKKEYKVHRVVCSAFKGPCPSSNHEVGHIDDNRSNNKPSNLEWVTRQSNMAKRHGKKRVSVEHTSPMEVSSTYRTLLW